MEHTENSQIPKIGFLLFNKPYMVYHSIGIAIELAKNPIIQVNLFCSKRTLPTINDIMENSQCQGLNITIDVLEPHWHSNLPEFMEYATLLRLSIFYKYKRLFQTFDAFVCTTYNDLSLKKRITKTSNAKFIFTHHGVPNREYAFKSTITGFDLFLLFGPKIKKIRQSRNQLTALNHIMTGYPKYDIIEQNKQSFFVDKRKTILYNPHWKKKFTSFYKFGFAILDFFSKSDKYNLIFAPHQKLLSRKPILRKRLEKYNKYSNIVIDLGSERSNNMTYTIVADLYLGDGSSQALEFIYHEPRPLLFLDAHAIKSNPKENLLSWELGVVTDTIDDFESQIEIAISGFEKTYMAIQIEYSNDLFYRGEKSPSELASDAIIELISR